MTSCLLVPGPRGSDSPHHRAARTDTAMHTHSADAGDNLLMTDPNAAKNGRGDEESCLPTQKCINA